MHDSETEKAVAQSMRRDRRLRILQMLAEANACVMNEAVVKDVLPALGHVVSFDLVRTELAWLAEQGLLELRESDGLWIAQLTQRGKDVVCGEAKQPGVAE